MPNALWFNRPPVSAGTRRFARGLALAFLVGWLVVLMAGADFPPPAGFALVALLAALASACIYWRVPSYLHWQSARWPRRLPAVLFDGIVIGLVFACVPSFLSDGEPSVVPTTLARFTWFAVLAGVGMVNSLLVYACAATYRRTVGRAGVSRD